MRSGNQTAGRLRNRLLIIATVLAFSLSLMIAGCGNGSGSSEATSHSTRAQTYAEQGQYRSAIVEMRNAIQAEPDNPDHVVRLASIYLTIGANTQATDLLEPWLSEFPEQVGLTLARGYVEQGKQLSAIETLGAFSADTPKEQIEAELIRAEAARLKGDSDAALQIFESLLAENLANEKALTGLARILIAQNRNKEAIEKIESWTENNGKSAEALYLKGLAFYQDNDLANASDTLTDAVSAVPNSEIFLPIRRNILTVLSRVLTEQGNITGAQIYNRVLAENTNTEVTEQGESALAAIREGDLEQAKEILRDMLSLDPENEHAAMMLGAVLAETGDTDEGVRLLTENLDPETTPTQFIRAATMVNVDKGKRKDALKTLERAIKARPNDNELLAMHGVVALSLPEHQDDGIASLSKAISREPERVRLRLALAQHYSQKGLTEQALGQLRMAFTSNPSDWATTRYYLSLLLNQGENEEAEEIRDSLLTGYPDEPFATLLASIADVGLGNEQAALERLEKLVAENQELQPALLTLATLYASQGQTEKAVDTLVEAARRTPERILPLQRAVQIYASQHTIEEVKRWLMATGNEYAELKMNADILSALINIRQGTLDNAKENLKGWDDKQSAALRRTRAELFRAETIAATEAQNFDDAREKAAQAIALQPENLGFALLPISIYQTEGKIEKALSALVAIEDNFGDQPQIILARTTLLRQHEGSESAYSYLLEQWNRTESTSLMPLLVRLASNEAPDDLSELTNDWVQAAPDSVPAHMARADWLMKNNREKVAANHYERVLEQQANSVAALNNLAWLLRKENQNRALDLANQAQALAPDNPAVLDTYGWILHLSGRHSEAKEVIEKALSIVPDNVEIQGHLKAIQQAL